ncbi:hypothetical protein AB5I41_04385 [Sphingomonas sp. MMS24-JH45]
MARSREEALNVANRIGYPVLMRPSYVLGGRAMEIVDSDQQLEDYIRHSAGVGRQPRADRPIPPRCDRGRRGRDLRRRRRGGRGRRAYRGGRVDSATAPARSRPIRCRPRSLRRSNGRRVCSPMGCRCAG